MSLRPTITEGKLREISVGIKALGLDGILNKLLKLVAKTRPKWLIGTFESSYSFCPICLLESFGKTEYIVAADVPQVFVLGLMLWNVMLDGVLGLCVSEEAALMGFKENLAVIRIAKHLIKS